MRRPTWDVAVLDAHRLVARVQKCQAYQFCDPFDHYNTASELYETTSGTITYSSAYERFAPPAGLPGQGIKCSGGSFSYVRKNLQSNQATLIIKVAVSAVAMPGSGDPGSFLAALDNGTTQWSLVILNNGAFGIILGASPGTTEAITGPGAIAAGLYYGIEVTVTIAGAASTVTAWINGVQVINATGLNLQVTANAYANQVAIGDMHNKFGSGLLFDDFRVWDSTGSTQNAALGTDSRLITKMPSGAGAATAWTPNGAAANWQCVDDNPPDGDTTYVSAAAASTEDAYAMPSAAMTAAPSMVVARSYVRKDDGATRTLQIGVSSSGTLGFGSTFTIGSTYSFIDSCIALDPHTSAAWTAAGADAAQHCKNELS